HLGHEKTLARILTWFFWPSVSGSDDDGTVVLTTSGPIRGKRLQAGSSTVTAFLGIPYAEPPVGTLRFQKPLPHQPWSQILETTSFGNVCPQPSLPTYPEAKLLTPTMPQSEDCLFLNVWVPHPRPPAPAPILIWIHGGGFFTGAASLEIYDGRFLAATGKIIVASMNYRLGALGFLSLPPAAPGNAGLWDQRLALRWLRDNAAAFGGDPAHVMLSGHGSGAASVGFHLLSPGSRPLFTRAVLQSGSPTAPSGSSSLEEAKERGQRLGQLLGCTDSDDTALVGCLQGKEAGEFPKHEFSVLRHRELLGMPFVPTTDGDFLPDSPSRLLQAKQSQPIPIAAGFTANEGSYLLLFAAPTLQLQNASNVGMEELLQVLKLMVPGAPEEAVQAVARWYSQEGEKQGEAQYRWAMEQIVGDYIVVCPVAEVARRETEAGANSTHTEAEEVLSRTMMQWTAEFARTMRAAVTLWPGEHNIQEEPTGKTSVVFPVLPPPDTHTNCSVPHSAPSNVSEHKGSPYSLREVLLQG
uniref:Carboxylesterase type B domain-containing protein n=1 Tax=Chrysemys picta bellii TaxID=8478 RepID=A0A8C3FF43_CHRPI